MLRKILGENIRRLRKENGLSQQEAALMAGITSSYWGYIERGCKNLSLDTLEKIAEVLGVEGHILLIASPDKNIPAELMQLTYRINNLGIKHIEFLHTVLKAYIKTVEFRN